MVIYTILVFYKWNKQIDSCMPSQGSAQDVNTLYKYSAMRSNVYIVNLLLMDPYHLRCE